MSQDNQQPSQVIKTFLDFLDIAKGMYRLSVENMRLEDKKTQDYLHKLELEDLSYHESV